jgi:hypothetical protein
MFHIDKRNRWKIALLIIAPVVFFIEKYVHAGIRLSDTNLYYAMGEAVLHGKFLYKDIFFTNLPLFPYISAFYTILSGKNLIFYYLTGSLEAIVCYLLIFIIGYIKTRDFVISFFGAILFLFSFTILYISDSQTGVLTASLFLLLGYVYIEQGKRYVTGGIFLALCLLTKAYFAPVVAAFFIAPLLAKSVKSVIKMVTGFSFAFAFIAGPYLITFPSEIITQLSYAGMRSVGFPKLELLKYVATFDFVLLCVFAASFIVWKKNNLIAVASFFFVFYFVTRGSMYPIYLCMIIPLLSIHAQELGSILQQRIQNKKILPIIISGYIISMFFIYINDYARLGMVNHIEEMSTRIRKEKPSFIYGVADLAPALSQKTGVPLLEGIIDTNAEIYQKGFLDKTKLSKLAVQKKAVIISEGIYMPEYKTDEKMDNNTFDKKLLLSKCKEMSRYPVQGQEFINRIYLFKCF